jgi:hypothetical protein
MAAKDIENFMNAPVFQPVPYPARLRPRFYNPPPKAAYLCRGSIRDLVAKLGVRPTICQRGVLLMGDLALRACLPPQSST